MFRNLRPFMGSNIHSIFDDFFDDPSFYSGRLYGNYNMEKINNTDYQIIINAAGLKRDEIEIILDNGYLTVSGKHKEYNKNEDQMMHRGLSFEFENKFSVPDNARVVSANLRDGLLTIVINNPQLSPDARKIRVQ